MTDSGQPSDPKFEIEDELDYLFANASPNPNREGCPSREVLIGLSRREKPIGHPDYLHIVRCSPCFREFRAFQQADKANARAKKLWAAAAVVILATVGAWVMLGNDRSTAPVVGQPSSGAISADLTARLDLRPYAVTRSDERRTEPNPVVIPQGRVTATILLPVGAEPGEYEIRLLDQDLALRASSTGSAAVRDFVTTLETTIDLSSVATGKYQLGLRRSGGEWQMFPALFTVGPRAACWLGLRVDSSPDRGAFTVWFEAVYAFRDSRWRYL
jgi:hypothetical protein